MSIQAIFLVTDRKIVHRACKCSYALPLRGSAWDRSGLDLGWCSSFSSFLFILCPECLSSTLCNDWMALVKAIVACFALYPSSYSKWPADGKWINFRGACSDDSVSVVMALHTLSATEDFCISTCEIMEINIIIIKLLTLDHNVNHAFLYNILIFTVAWKIFQ